MGSHRCAPNGAGQFSSPIESSATPCRPLGEGRESGAPAPRGTMVFAGGGALSARLVIGVNSLLRGNQNGEGAIGHAASTYLTHAPSMRIRCLP